MKRALLALCCAACTDSDRGAEITYPWDGRQVLCSASMDDYKSEPPWDFIEASLDIAARDDVVTIVHAHVPGITIQPSTIEHLLVLAQNRGLQFVTFRDFDRLTPRGGLALAFDDNSPDEWMTTRELLAQYDAHVTYFVTRWIYMTDAEHDELRTLASSGHDLQPHSVDHLHALDFVAEHGIDAYIAEQVLPSVDVLAAEGYPGTTYAYPFGDHDDVIDAALLAHVGHVRTTLGPCPW